MLIPIDAKDEVDKIQHTFIIFFKSQKIEELPHPLIKNIYKKPAGNHM